MTSFMSGKRIPKRITGHKRILNYLIKKWGIPKEEDIEDDSDILKIYDVNRTAWYVLIISLNEITFGLERQ